MIMRWSIDILTIKRWMRHHTHSHTWYIHVLCKWNYENHHVMTCTGNKVNAIFIPNNFDHVLIAVDIMIFLESQNNMDLACYSPGLFVAQATRGFRAVVKRLNWLEICFISVHQHSAGAWNIVRTNPSVVFNLKCTWYCNLLMESISLCLADKMRTYDDALSGK